MLNKTVRFSPLNPFRFVKQNTEKLTQYGYHPYGYAHLATRQRPQDVLQPYMVKYQYSDFITFQFHVAVGTPAAVPYLVDSNGTLLQELTQTHQLAVPGNTGPNGEQFITLQYQFTPQTYAALDGKQFVYIRLDVVWDGDNTIDYYLSEPIWLRKTHKDTVLAEYTNYTNDYDTIFEGINPVFRMRIPSMGLKLRMAGEYTTFENQSQELTKLYAQTYRNFILDIGGRTGVPDYVTDSISFLLNCDYVMIDGKAYVKEDGAEMEAQADERSALQYYEILLREKDHQSSYTFVNQDHLLWARGADFSPYAFPELIVTVNAQTIYSAVRVHNSTVDEDNLMNDWNDHRGVWGMRGEFVNDGEGNFYYRQAVGETVTVTKPVMYNKVLELTVNVNGGFNKKGRFRYSFTGGSHIFFPGVGTAYYRDSSVFQVWHDYGSSVGANTTRTVKLFHNDEMYTFNHNGSNQDTDGRIINITGLAPAFLQQISVFKEDFSTIPTFSLEFLRPAAGRLTTLSFHDCKLNAITPGWGMPLLPAPKSNMPYPLLNSIFMGRNNFSAWAVDSLLIEIATGTNYPVNGYVDTKTSKSFNAPTSASATARTALTNAGWYVVTD